MNQKKAYEQIITGKLEALPLPDLADAIWARIETQLDIDMPEGDGGPGSGPSSGGGWIGGAGLFVFVAALITIFLLSKNKNKENSLVLPNRTQQQAPATTPVINSGPLIDNTRREVQTSAPARVQPKNDSTTSDFPGLMPSPDITGNNPPSDSVQQATAIQLPPFLPADTVVKKRPRGVQGITDNDYRIVPKKDSTNN
ncbi:MAG TPA: hypothetical protein VFQ73_17305 [Flavisolibacter sp.]|nr:hypothetical protein [Flavisolibacter sp.]